MLASIEITSGARSFGATTSANAGANVASGPVSFQHVIGDYHATETDFDEQNSREIETSPQMPASAAMPRKAQVPKQQSTQPAPANDSQSTNSASQTQEADTNKEIAESTAKRGANFRALLRKLRAMDAANSPEAKSQANAVPGTPKNGTDETAAIPIVPAHIAEPARIVLPLTAALTLRESGDASQDSPAVPPESATAAEAASPIPLPQIKTEDATKPDSLAFAARLTPETQPTPSKAAVAQPPIQADPKDTTRAGRSQLNDAATESARQLLTNNNAGGFGGDPHNTAGGDSSPRQNANELFTVNQAAFAAHATQPQNQVTAEQSVSTNSPAQSPATSHLDQIVEPAAAQSSANHDITIRIPNASDQSTAVRFLERGGEVHVSVRTTDTEIAQTLRSGLNDLVGRLQDGGIKTEVWQPGSDASTSQDHSQNPFTNPDGSNGHSSGSNSERESSQQQKPRWLEELENSLDNAKETSQLWQA